MSLTPLKTVLKIAVASALIYWLVQSEMLDLRALAGLSSQPESILLVGLSIISLMVIHWRWLQLLRAQGLAVTYWSSAPLTFIGLFFNFAIPGGVGGDVVKTYYLVRAQGTGRKLGAAVTVVWDRFIGLFSMLVVAVVALMTHASLVWREPELRVLALGVGLTLVSFVIALFLMSRPQIYQLAHRWAGSSARVRDILERLQESMAFLRKDPIVFWKCMAASWVSQGCAISFMLLVAHMSGEAQHWSLYFFIVPIVFVATALPISPAGVGVGQAAMYFLFKASTGEGSAVGPNAMTAWQMAQLLFGLVGAYFYLRARHGMAVDRVAVKA